MGCGVDALGAFIVFYDRTYFVDRPVSPLWVAAEESWRGHHIDDKQDAIKRN